MYAPSLIRRAPCYQRNILREIDNTNHEKQHHGSYRLRRVIFRLRFFVLLTYSIPGLRDKSRKNNLSFRLLHDFPDF